VDEEVQLVTVKPELQPLESFMYIVLPSQFDNPLAVAVVARLDPMVLGDIEREIEPEQEGKVVVVVVVVVEVVVGGLVVVVEVVVEVVVVVCGI
jgi:small basic protein